MRFRDDIDLDTTWVLSDTHFGHRNINDFANRPPDHESLMLERIASNVGPNDTLLHLGDLCYSNNAAFRALVAPHITGGRKLLIAGNHDKARYSFYKKCGFKLAQPFALPITQEGPYGMDPATGQTQSSLKAMTNVSQSGYADWIVSFAHYPWAVSEEGRPMHDGRDVRVHGHIHTAGYTRTGYVPFLKNHINISVEQTNYQPVNLRLLLEGALLGKYPDGGDPMADEPQPENHHARNAEAVAERFNKAISTHGA